MRHRIAIWIVAAACTASATTGERRSVAELMALGDSLARAARFDSAIAVERRALEMAEQAGGQVDTTVAQVLIKLGIAHFYKADFAECRRLWDRALAIREELFGPNHPATAGAMMYLGALHDELGWPAQAVPIFEKALAIYDASPSADPSQVADCANNLAISYLKLGRLAAAEAQFKRALALYEESQGPEDADVGGCLGNLAQIYADRGEFARALPMYERALRIQERTRGPNHPDVASTLVGAAGTYLALRQYEKAEACLLRATDIARRIHGPRHPEVGRRMANLAVAYLTQRRFGDAQPLLVEALEVLEAAFGPSHPDVAYALIGLGRALAGLGDYDQAEAPLLRALDIREKTLGMVHPLVAAPLTELGNLYYAQERYRDALDCHLRSLEINERLLGKDNPRIADALDNVSIMCRTVGREDSAIAFGRRSCEIRYANLRENGTVLSEEDALRFSAEFRESISKYVSAYFAAAGPKRPPGADVAEMIVRGKGQISDVMFERQRAIVSESEPAVRSLADSLWQYRQRLVDAFVKGPGEKVGAYRKEVAEIERAIERSETALLDRSRSFERWKESRSVTLTAIEKRLPAGSSLVEYILYQRVRLRPESVAMAYAALVLRGGHDPVVVDLGDAGQIDDLVGDYRRHFKAVAALGSPGGADVDDYRALAGDLYRRVWADVAPLVSGSDLVLICPDGALSLVSFAGLPVDEGDYLIERHTVHYLSSARDLLRLDDAPRTGVGLLALGDPDYDAPLDGSRDEAPRARAPHSRLRSALSGSASLRGNLPDCDDFWNTVVGPLPGTRREIESIAGEWAQAGDEAADLLMGRDASEALFRERAGGKRVIHLATHGYYVGAACRGDANDGAGEGGLTVSHPLLLSGVFLAGANRRAESSSAPAAEDGVVTAFEVSSMDLRGCEMVVLSACETGLGKPEVGEGVYGLRRAFGMAGAATVVSALWEVGDRDAARFAGRLYQKSGQPLPRRIASLQVEILEELRARGRADHPLAWAAFIAQGEWRH